MVWPVVQEYALIENALGAAEGGASAHAQEIAALWARFNEVAQANPFAAFPAPRDADEIAVRGRPTGRWPSPTTCGTRANGP